MNLSIRFGRYGRIGFATLSLVCALGASLDVFAAIKPERVHTAEPKKSNFYIRDGLFVGGDRAIDQVIVRDIRRAANPSYERVVIDLEGNSGGMPAAIDRPPYYQVAVSPDEKRLVVTVFGSPRLTFDSGKVASAFRRSKIFREITLLPAIEKDTWTFAFEMKNKAPVEVFELSNPVRIIIDVKAAKK
jgi:hypothetical protein